MLQRKCINEMGALKGCKERDVKCLCEKNYELIEPVTECDAKACGEDVTPMMVIEISNDICTCVKAEEEEEARAAKKPPTR